MAAALLAAAATASPLAARQAEGGLPTLRDAGLGWVSSDGRWQVDLSGRLDVEVYAPSADPTWLIPSTDPFVAPRLRLFADVFIGERVYALAELRADRGDAPTAGAADARIQQAFVRVRPWPTLALDLQAGRFVSPFGAYPARHHTVADPFIRPPLPYDHRTMICPWAAPADAAVFASWKDDPDRFRPMGAPVVWGAPYPWGVLGTFGAGRWNARLAWVNSAPSSAPRVWGLDTGRLDAGSIVAGLGVQVTPALRLGASWNRGPYLEPLRQGTLPAGAALDDYVQEVWGLDASLSRGPAVVRGELFVDRWEVPNVADDARDVSWLVEAQTDLLAGVWVAGRWSAVTFRELKLGGTDGGPGRAVPWDYDIRRWQLSAGYRLFRNLEVRGEWLTNDSDGPLDPDDDLWSVQLWWAF